MSEVAYITEKIRIDTLRTGSPPDRHVIVLTVGCR